MLFSNTSKILFFTACFFTAMVSATTKVKAQTLENAVQSALQTHPGVESALQALNITKEQKKEAYSGYFPEISVNASAGRLYGDNSTSRGLSVTRGTGYSNLGEGSVTVSQLIFDGLETPRRVDAAEVRKMSAGMDVVNIKESLAFGAVSSYIDVLRARKALALISEHNTIVNDYLSRISTMVDEGASDETELQQARDIQVILSGIKTDFEGQVLSAEATFAEVVGAMPSKEMIEPNGVQSAIDTDVKQAVAKALNSHPSIMSAQLQARAASHDIKAEEGTLYPDFNGELSYLKSDKEDILGGEVIDARALVRMNWNFSTGGQQLAAIRRTKFAHKESLARQDELKRRIERDVRLAYSELQTSERQVGLFKKRRELNKKLFETYEAQFEGARVNLLQLMQSHNQLFNTNLESLNGKYRYLTAQYGVLASMGRLQNVVQDTASAQQSFTQQSFFNMSDKKNSKKEKLENQSSSEFENKGKKKDHLLECLVYLTKHYGRSKSAEALVAGLAYDSKNMGPDLFCEAAENVDIKTHIVKQPNIQKITHASLPAVLILGADKACVLLERSKNGKKCKVFLPETGGVKDIDTKTLKNDYFGFVIHVHPHAEFLNAEKADPDDTSRHWFWSIVYEARGIYASVLIASVFINLFVLVSPLFVMNVYDRVIPNNAIETGWALGLGALAVFVFDFVLKTIRGYMVDLSGRRIDVIAGRRIYDQVLNMKLSGRPKSSGVFANMLKDFDAVREFFTSASITVLVDLPFTIIFIFVIYKLAGSLAFVLVGLIFLVLLAAFILQFPLKSLVRKSIKSSEVKHGLLVETIHGLETIKSTGSDGRFRAQYGSHVAENSVYGQKSRFVSSLGVNFAAFVQQIATVVIILFGMYMIADGQLSIGGLIASVILGGRAIAPIGQVANLMTRYHQANSALKTLEGLMKQPVERPKETQFLHRPDLQGALSFKKVNFVYPGTDRQVLEQISFDIKAGEKVGLVGRIGSGKSTIAKLMMGLHEPSDGTIMIDNTDHRQIDPADLRKNVAYIAQDIFLFSGNIRDNIAASVPHASEEDIFEAAKQAGVHDFVSRHPMGYDAPVGEHGNNLSGGQKQAVAFARAILSKPKILVCDEPTNAMDVQAENAFMSYIQKQIPDTTLIMITHKTSMLPVLDRLILLDQGKVIVDGARDKVLEALKGGQVKVQA